MKNFFKKIIPDAVLRLYHWTLALLGAIIYGFPSRKLKVIGVTGTKGKTTTCDLIAQILRGAGFKTGLATTVNFRIGEQEWKNEHKQTMLGRFKLQKILRQMVRQGCQYAVIETSSEGILQFRHRFIDYSAAVFTNLSPEHIERHGSFEKYRAAKLELFKKVAGKKDGVGVYNLDDKNAEFFLAVPVVRKYGFSLLPVSASQQSNEAILRQPGGSLIKLSSSENTSGSAIIRAQISNIKLFSNRSEFDFNDEHFSMPLLGEFNVANAGAAICLAISQAVAMEKIKEILKTAKPPAGRLELINEGQPFVVIVDYAHEPASLEAVYKTIKIFHPRKIIALLGAQGGGRDKSKRPILGEIASCYADYIIVTNEDPYDEKPEKIIEEVISGIKNKELKIKNREVFAILDRREAIKKALALAQSGDAVILTGKGGESWMCVANGRKIPWDESLIVKEELRKLKN